MKKENRVLPNRTLNVEPLTLAVQSLDRALSQPKNEFTRDSVIQRFEYTLELSWKFIKIKLEKEGIKLTDLTPKGIIRECAKAGKISNPETWFEFIDNRNRTSHTYNESVADEVYEVAKRLPDEVRRVLAWLGKE